MRFFVIAVLMLVLSSCYTQNYRATTDFRMELKEVDYFDEWGLFRITAFNLYGKGSQTLTENSAIDLEQTCLNLFVKSPLGARLFDDAPEGKPTLECFSIGRTVNSRFQDDYFLRSIFEKDIKWVKKDSVYHVLYGGDSLMIESKFILDHKQVCHEKDIKKCLLEKDFDGKKIYFEGPFYEVLIPADQRVYSFVIRTNPKDLEGYKPLKLDPSILPLESPGYKKLREQEEALGRK